MSRWNVAAPSRESLGILVVSLAILVSELLLTRIFSVVMYHHFSFLAVSLAMMGIGFGGLVVGLRPSWFRRDTIPRVAPILCLLFAVTLIAAVWLAFYSRIKLDMSAETLWRVILVLCASLVPLLCGGVVVAHILATHWQRANRLYFFDLLGAGLACLIFVPLTGAVGAPTAIILSGAMATVGGLILARSSVMRWTLAAFTLALVVLGAVNARSGFFDVHYRKGGKQEPTLVQKWNSFSRVEVIGKPGDMERVGRPKGWGFSTELRYNRAKELPLKYDASALTEIVGFDGDLEKVEYLLWDVTAAPHHLRPSERVAVIGAGGGRDVLAALAAGSAQVAAVEVNGLTVDLMRGEFRDYTGGLYVDHPAVSLVHEDGRSFVRSTDQRFDLIQASLVDTWAASAAGAYALAENTLYTVDAFVEYLNKLTADGLISFSRWYGSPPVEVLRLLVLAQEAFKRVGIDQPELHIAVVRTKPGVTRRPSLASILVKRSPLGDEECYRFKEWSDKTRFEIAYFPPVPNCNIKPRPEIVELFETGWESVSAKRGYDLSPVTDNKPFFFDRVPLAAWMKHKLGLDAPRVGAMPLTLGGKTLLVSAAVTLGFTLLLLILPLILRRRKLGADDASRLLPLGRRIAWIGYFLCLGLGYIAVEIVLIQKLGLYLGSPVYSLTVVMFTMLVSSSIGGLLGGLGGRRLLITSLALVAVGIACLAFVVLPVVVDATLGKPAWQRIFFAVLAFAPVAMVMGMPFPIGFRILGQEDDLFTSWAWAINGGASVFASVLAVMISMTFGFTACLLAAAGVYVVACLLSLVLLRHPPAESIRSEY